MGALEPVSVTMLIGAVLMYAVTPTLYCAYACTQQGMFMSRVRMSLPIVTDMLGDWPFLSCSSLGLGVTLLFNATMAVAVSHSPPEEELQLHQRAGIVAVCITTQVFFFSSSYALPKTCIHLFVTTSLQVGVWIVIASSNVGLNPAAMMVHNMGAFLFMSSVVLTLHFTASAFYGFAPALGGPSDQGGKIMSASDAAALRTAYSISSVCVWLGAFGTLVATCSAVFITSMHSTLEQLRSRRQSRGEYMLVTGDGEDSPSSARLKWIFGSLAASELFTVASCGVGCFSTIYSYTLMKAWVQSVAQSVS